MSTKPHAALESTSFLHLQTVSHLDLEHDNYHSDCIVAYLAPKNVEFAVNAGTFTVNARFPTSPLFNETMWGILNSIQFLSEFKAARKLSTMPLRHWYCNGVKFLNTRFSISGAEEVSVPNNR